MTMSEPTNLYCTLDEDTGEWNVWFPHPLGGMFVLETFTNEDEAKAFWKEQIDNADYDN